MCSGQFSKHRLLHVATCNGNGDGAFTHVQKPHTIWDSFLHTLFILSCRALISVDSFYLQATLIKTIDLATKSPKTKVTTSCSAKCQLIATTTDQTANSSTRTQFRCTVLLEKMQRTVMLPQLPQRWPVLFCSYWSFHQCCNSSPTPFALPFMNDQGKALHGLDICVPKVDGVLIILVGWCIALVVGRDCTGGTKTWSIVESEVDES